MKRRLFVVLTARCFRLDLHSPELSPAEAANLMTRAHERCPYSNATRGNIEVRLSVDGVSVDKQQAITSQRNGAAERSAVAIRMGPAPQAMGTD
jgi:hypothetical protein